MGKLYTASSSNTLGFSYDFSANKPFDTREVVSTYNDLLNANTWKVGVSYMCYKGIKVSCADTGKIYVYIGETGSPTEISKKSNWIKQGGSGNGGGGEYPDLTLGTSPLGYNSDGGLYIKLGTRNWYTRKGAGLTFYEDFYNGIGINCGPGLNINSSNEELCINTGWGLLTQDGALKLDSSVLPVLPDLEVIGGYNPKGKYSFEISTLAFGKGIKVSTDYSTEHSVMDIDVISPLYINNNNQIGLDTSGIEYIDTIQDIIKNQFNTKNGFIINRSDSGIKEVSLNLGEGLELSTSNALTISPEILESIAKKQDLLESGTNIKTINNESILGEGNIDIIGGPAEYISDFINGGVVNLTTTGDVETIYNSLNKGAIALCIIGDSNGNYPSSTENRININSEYCQSLKYFFSTDPRGANVGDLLMITKQSYLSFLSVPALRIIPINDAKTANESFTGTEGIVTVWDKERINKIDGIEWAANHVRDNYLPKSDRFPSKWESNMNNALTTGVYPWCTLGRPNGATGAFTCLVNKTSTNDGNYDTIEQTAYGREGELGQIYKRIIFYKSDGTDTQYGAWTRVDNTNESSSGGSNDGRHPDISTEPQLLPYKILGYPVYEQMCEVSLNENGWQSGGIEFKPNDSEILEKLKKNIIIQCDVIFVPLNERIPGEPTLMHIRKMSETIFFTDANLIYTLDQPNWNDYSVYVHVIYAEKYN